jgi:hypothetical protein
MLHLWQTRGQRRGNELRNFVPNPLSHVGPTFPRWAPRTIAGARPRVDFDAPRCQSAFSSNYEFLNLVAESFASAITWSGVGGFGG